jgi:hypothetical protein
LSPDDRRLRVIRATYLALCGVTILAGLFICSGCENEPSAEVPDGCAPARWSEVMRGCVETGEDGGKKGRLTLPDCCGRAP